ncbi:MAG TPA: flagellar type III secretion system pore protein FliP [Myxococcales bacterium]|nr:flagellar type III secretion system pore protein FliP [Myxococcales bacterium]
MNLLAVANDPAMQLTVASGGSSAVKLFLLLTVLSFASAALMSITSFTRVIIVLSFLRQGLGAPTVPPNQVLIGLALAITCFVMAPTANRVYAGALQPYFDDKISPGEAIDRASIPVREFLLKQTRGEDLRLFYEASGAPRPAKAEEIPLTICVPAFMVSELTTAFRMGLFVYLPLLFIDLLVSSVLMSLGMAMIPPSLVALPLKLGVFLLADGWHSIVASLLRSF